MSPSDSDRRPPPDVAHRFALADIISVKRCACGGELAHRGWMLCANGLADRWADPRRTLPVERHCTTTQQVCFPSECTGADGCMCVCHPEVEAAPNGI